MLASLGVLESHDNLGTNDDAIGDGRHGLEMLARGDAEADGGGLVATVPLDAFDKLGEVGIQGTQGTGDTLARDDVDEGVGEGTQKFHAGVGRGGGDQRNIRQTTTATEIAEGDGLLGRQVADDEAADTGGLAVGQQSFLAIAQEGVVVAHQEHGDGQALSTGIFDHLESGPDCDAVGEGDGVGGLNGRAIGDGICEGNA